MRQRDAGTNGRVHAPTDCLIRAANLLLPAYSSVSSGVSSGDAEVLVSHDLHFPPPRADACVYVCPAAGHGRFHTLARERFGAHLRASPPAGYHVTAMHRVTLGPSVRAGMLIELQRGERRPRVIDEVMSETGARPPMRFSSGGAILADYGPDHIQRTSMDPTPATDALRSLDGHPSVPALVTWGTAGGAVWSIESKLHGQRAKQMTRELAADVLSFCASLPQLEEPPTTPFSDLAELRFAIPEREDVWTMAEERLQRLLPDVAVARHGDLWVGNVLHAKGRLRGIVDWDAFDARAMPGTDLLNVFSFDTSAPFGQSVVARPWASERFASLTRAYWQTLGLSMTADVLEAAGLAWWIGHLAIAVSREPSLVTDRSWTADNIDAVAPAFQVR